MYYFLRARCFARCTHGKKIMSEELERKTLRTEGLVKIYGKRTVVNDVSFTVTQGEIVGLLGPNGAGKTTSFYMTTGLVVPSVP